MSGKKRGLGRGLESLLSNEFDDVQASEAIDLREVALDELSAGRYQPRRDLDDDALEALAQSIRSQGVVQPLVARDTGEAYEIVAGERRWRAARMAGLEAVPVVIRQVEDATAMAVALIENIQREDLNPLEESAALQRLIDECGMTHAACAEAVGRSRASVSNLLRLSELSPQAQAYLRNGQLDMGHARALLGAPPELQDELAHKAVERALTVRQTESLVQSALDGNRPRPEPTPRPAALARFERDLAAALGASVTVKQRRGKRARVIIDYDDATALETLVARLK